MLGCCAVSHTIGCHPHGMTCLFCVSVQGQRSVFQAKEALLMCVGPHSDVLPTAHTEMRLGSALLS